MSAATWGWTERHTPVAVVLVVALGGSLVGLTEEQPLPHWIALATAFSAVLGLFFDVWAGALVGLSAAVLVVAARRWADYWSPEVFSPALLETLALIVVGAAAGHAGSAVRKGGHPAPGYSPFEPVHGSLGLLGEHAAMTRLEEEVVRGERQLRPVTLVLFDVLITDESLPAAGLDAAHRAVARVVESRAGEHDIPFALTADRLGIIFPDTPLAAVWAVVGRVLESTTSATFTFGTERTPRPLSGAVDVLVGIGRQSQASPTAGAILDEAMDALQRGRGEGSAS